MPDDFNIQFLDLGHGMWVTAFCPFCKAQVFGYTCSSGIEDLIEHLNLFHPGHPHASQS